MRTKRKDAVDRLYDGFVVKDLSRKEFRKQYFALMDPDGLRRDLVGVVKTRQTKRTLDFMAGERKRKINEAIVGSN